MGTYVARRLLAMIPVLLGATFLIFVLVFYLPGDPVAGKCGGRACTDAFVATFTAEHNLNDPLLVRYGKYLGKLAQGDLGTSFFDRPVREELAARFPVTAKLALLALLCEAVLGVTAGVVAGVRKGRFIDSLVLVSSLALIAIPVLVLGSVLQMVVGVQLRWLPITVSANPGLLELLMPAFVLAAASVAYLARLTRNSLVDNLRADYVRTAVAKGLSRRRVVGVHTLRNSLIPVVTFMGYDLGALMGGAIITEYIFNVQGVGTYLVTAIRARDGMAVVGTVTALVLIYLVVNLLVDLLYGVLDPRISHE